MFVVMLWTRTTCQGQNKECFFGTETRIQCRDHNIEQLNTRAILQCCTGCRRKKVEHTIVFLWTDQHAQSEGNLSSSTPF